MAEDIAFLTLWQVQGYWRRSESALRRSIADGALRPLRHRRRVFLSLEEIRRCELAAGGASLTELDDIGTPLLTVGDAAPLVRYRRNYLYELAAAGEVPCLRIFGTVRFRTRDLVRWLHADGAVAADALNENRTADRRNAGFERNGA